MSCKARRQNDQMHCGPCGVQWDVDDPEPPACGLECLGAAERLVDEDACKAFVRTMRSWAPRAGVDAPLDPDFDTLGVAL